MLLLFFNFSVVIILLSSVVKFLMGKTMKQRAKYTKNTKNRCNTHKKVQINLFPHLVSLGLYHLAIKGFKMFNGT